MFRSMLLSSIGFIGCGLGTLFVGFSGFSAFFFVLGVLYFGIALWFRIDVPIRAWNKRLELHSPIHLAFNDDGVITQTVDSESKIPWRNYPYSKEWSDYYLIQRSRRSGARVVPKRGFHSKDDELNFRELLESKTMFVPQGGRGSLTRNRAEALRACINEVPMGCPMRERSRGVVTKIASYQQ